MSDVFAPQPIKTKSNGDAVIKIVDYTTNTQGQAINSSGAASSNLTYVGGSAVALGSTTASASLPVTLASNDTNTTPFVTSGGGGYVRQDSTATIAKESGGNLATLAGGVSSSKYQSNIAQVGGSALALGQTTMSASVPVAIASNQGAIPTTVGLTGTDTDTYGTSASLAAGSTVTIDSTNIASGTGHLVDATVSSSVALKAQLGTWNGTTFTVFRTFFVPANGTVIYQAPRSDAITLATGTTAKFRWSITNNDNANTADVYCSTNYYYA
jgi:hypothetical protein